MSMGGFGFSWFYSGSGGITPAVYPSFLPDGVTSCCLVNNMPIEQLGFTLERHDRWLDGVATARPDVEMVRGMTGGRLKPLGVAAPREMSLVGHFLETSIDTRHLLLNVFTDAFRGLLEVVTPDAEGYVMRAVAGPVQVESVSDRQYWEPALRVTIPLLATDGAKYSRHMRMVPLDTTPRAVPLGNLPSGGEFVLQGPLSGTVHIDLIAPNGQRIYRFTLIMTDGGIEDGGNLRIRLDYPTAMLYTDADGVVTSVAHWRSLASSRWWFVPPFYSDRARNSYPMLRMSTGSGVYRYFVAMEH